MNRYGRAGAGTADPITGFALKLLDYVGEVGAAKHVPVEHFCFGPLSVSLAVVGDTLRRRLTTAIAFAGREILPAEPWHLTAVDGAIAGIGAPPDWTFPVSSQRHLERLHEDADGSVNLRYDPGTLTWRALSVPERRAIMWTADANGLPEWDDSAPCRDLLHWMTLPTELFLAHAAAVGIGGKGVLLTGPGGSGKSTTTAAAVLRGLSTTGDDFILVDPRAREAHALYDAIKLAPRSEEWLPELAARIANPGRPAGEKGRIHLSDACPAALVSRLPIAAVLLPRLSGHARTTIVPAATGEAVRALVPSTIFLVRGGEAKTTRKATAFLRELPAYHCNLGGDPIEAADTIAAFIEGLPN